MASFDLGRPDARTRAIWLTQLALTAGAVAVNVLVLALEPVLLTRPSYAIGFIALVAVTIATLAVPWSRLPERAVVVVPFVDAVAIGFIDDTPEWAFSFLWVFPVMWVGMFFSSGALAAMIAMVAAAMLTESFFIPTAEIDLLSAAIVVICLIAIGVTSHLTVRNARALRRILHRQAVRLSSSLEERSAQERRTSEILNGIDVGIVRVSPQGTILSVNDAYAALYALDPDDPERRPHSVEYTHLRGTPLPEDQTPLARAARGERFVESVVWLYTPDGQWRTLSVSASRLDADADGETTLLVAKDITAITYSQHERERLIAIASHELKSPLTIVMGNAELALDAGDDLTPRVRERLETIHNAGERMLTMAQQMLKTTRGGSEGESLEPVELHVVLLASVSSYRPTASLRDIAIEFGGEDHLPVIGDAFRLRQVIDNLLSNAIKYTPDGGEVIVSGTIEGEHVVVAVTDTGIGIAPEDLPSIMEPYFRTRHAQQTASGTGLGLGISREIVTAHGGTLTIDSDHGVGTTVVVRLPLAGAREKTEEDAG